MSKSNKYKLIDKDKIKSSKHFIPSIIESNEIEKHSWYDIQKYNYNTDIKPIQTKSINNTVIRCKQIKITPTVIQKEILLEWIEIARLVYNITVQYLKHNKNESFISLRKIIKSLFKPSFKERIAKAKVHVLVIDNAIHDVVKALKTSIALLKAGHIKYFRLRFRKQSKPTQTITIEKLCFSKNKNAFGIKVLGEIKSSQPIKYENITRDCKLTYDHNKNLFILHKPEDITIIESTEQYKTCACDPGLYTFQTVYNPEGECIKICNRNTTKKLTSLINKKIKLKKMTKLENKNKKISQKKFINNVNKAILRNNAKISNNVKELHYKTAIMLCKSYDNIYLGKLSTKAIIKKRKGKQGLSKFDKHYALALSHFTFSQVLKNKCIEFGKKLYYVDESYTSKTCGSCGKLNDVKRSRVYACKTCMNEYDRDMNAARNILIKNE